MKTTDKKTGVTIIRFTFVSGWIVLTGFFTNAQENRLRYADKLYNEMAYYNAKEAYEDVLQRTKDSMTVAKKVADCYEKLNDADKSVEWYSFLESKNQLTKEELLILAMRYRDVGKYDKSITALNKYESTFGTDISSTLIRNTGEEINKLNTAQSGNFTIDLSNVNTSSSDIGAVYGNDNHAFIASNERNRWSVNRQDGWSGAYFYEAYICKEDGDISKKKRMKGDINDKYHDGPMCYSAKDGKVYFTRNNMKKSKAIKDVQGIVRLKVYRGTLNGRKVENVEGLPFNSDDYSCAHPSVSADGKYLYFSSDKPGGMGGSDIYRVELKEDGSIGAPVNLGNKINTPQDEYFPVVHSKDPLLYFSSNGHKGLGGQDVYYAIVSPSGEVSKIENMGAPVNSSRDDFSFTNNKEQTKGYFTSNRAGFSNDQVYRFDQKEPIMTRPSVSGTARDLATNEILPDTKIEIIDNGTVIVTTITDSLGNYKAELPAFEGNYDITGKKNKYDGAKEELTINPNSFDYQKDLKLAPRYKYIVAGDVTDATTNEKLPDVNVEIIDNKTEQLIASGTTGQIGNFLSDPFNTKYGEHLDISLKLSKQGYLPLTLKIQEILVKDSILRKDGILLKPIEKGDDIGKHLDLKPIYFDLNKADIRPDAAAELDKIVAFMKQNPTIKIELGSHTDSRSSSQYNISLSDKRAKASAKYIISKGIADDRIKGKGYGESKLQISDTEINKAPTEEEKERLHQLNRRTVFEVVDGVK